MDLKCKIFNITHQNQTDISYFLMDFKRFYLFTANNCDLQSEKRVIKNVD